MAAEVFLRTSGLAGAGSYGIAWLLQFYVFYLVASLPYAYILVVREEEISGFVVLIEGSLNTAIYSSKPDSKPQAVTICVTPACVLAASEILQNISPRYSEIDPCSNFEAFVCEGWQEKHDLRADQDSSFTGTLMQENSQTILRHVLETPFSDSHPRIDPNSSPEASIFNKLKDAYDACMEEDKLKGLGAEPLLNVLHKIEKLFPAAKPHASENFPKLLHQAQKGLVYKGENQLAATVAYLISIGVDALVSFNVGVS